MQSNKILSKASYFTWARKKYDIDFKSVDCKETYENNATIVKAAVQNRFDQRLKPFLEKSERSYSRNPSTKRSEEETTLFMAPSELDVKWETKPFLSVLDKTYRYNVVDNQAWNAEPPGGMMKPDNWFLKLEDSVRTRIVCKYIDGPKYLAERLHEFATDTLHLKAEPRSKQKDDGYYAYHVQVKIPASVLIGGKFEKIKVTAEIQITTQLQDVLSKITHHFYEQTRLQREPDPFAWKWQIKDDRFRAAYLSHTLHLLEAIIQETRSRNGHSPKS